MGTSQDKLKAFIFQTFSCMISIEIQLLQISRTLCIRRDGINLELCSHQIWTMKFGHFTQQRTGKMYKIIKWQTRTCRSIVLFINQILLFKSGVLVEVAVVNLKIPKVGWGRGQCGSIECLTYYQELLVLHIHLIKPTFITYYLLLLFITFIYFMIPGPSVMEVGRVGVSSVFFRLLVCFLPFFYHYICASLNRLFFLQT